jgi:hypothetical protein
VGISAAVVLQMLPLAFGSKQGLSRLLDANSVVKHLSALHFSVFGGENAGSKRRH